MSDVPVDPLADPQVVDALRLIDRRRRQGGLPCPKCMQAPIAHNTPEGWCQPCSTEQRERIKASRRRSYHRTKAGADDDIGGEPAEGELADDGRNPHQVGELPQVAMPSQRPSRGRR